MENKNISPEYIYLLQEREFIKTGENIYKVGKTKQENDKRFKQYPKGSLMLCQVICNGCDNAERIIINIFKKHFIHRQDIGNEYFEGNYQEMVDIIFCFRHQNTCNEINEIINKIKNKVKENIISAHNKIEEANTKELINKQKLIDIKTHKKEQKEKDKVENEILRIENEKARRGIPIYQKWLVSKIMNGTLNDASSTELYNDYKEWALKNEGNNVYSNISCTTFGKLLTHPNGEHYKDPNYYNSYVSVKCRKNGNVFIKWDKESLIKILKGQHLLSDDFLSHGINHSKEIIDYTEEYMLRNNPVGAWLRKRYNITNNTADRVPRIELYNEYKAEAKVYKSHIEFSKDIERCNINVIQAHGKRYYFGIVKKVNNKE